ncbi:putative eka-like protein [Erysiphe necator]|uniref:Putative eka-like protein n=1 Tax=Uncinula necator TaxID=52586 RepID=A0A0B1P061_UNCNE|nr:putative eka-like protein [Erysiphe necator]
MQHRKHSSCLQKRHRIKEEDDLVKNYLQQAITLLAASDNASKSPPIPHLTKPLKTKGFIQGKDLTKNKAPNIFLNTLTSQKESQPRKSIPEDHFEINKVQQNSWVMIARNGHKKSRAQQSLQNPMNNTKPLQHHLPVQSPSIMRNSKNSKKSNLDKSDSRLFVRLPLEHEWRKLSPAGIREVIVKRLSISPASIGLIKPVRIGLGGLFLSVAKLEPATQWIPLLIPTVLKTINTLQGRKEISKLMLADEIERVSSVRPEAVKLNGYQKPDAMHRTWLALFTQKPKPGFRVFDESGISSIFKKQTPIEFCKRCNRHYSSKSTLEHLHVENMGQLCTLKVYIWLQRGVEIVEGLIGLTVENVSHAQRVMELRQKNN